MYKLLWCIIIFSGIEIAVLNESPKKFNEEPNIAEKVLHLDDNEIDRNKIIRKKRQLDVFSEDSSRVTPESIMNCLANCPVTSEYNPVCGSNGMQYSNPGSLTCAAFCTKSRITIKHHGSCNPNVRSH